MTPQDLKDIVEAAIFASSGPIKIEQIQKLFEEEEMPGKEAIRAVINRLMEDYEGRGITLSEVASGFRFQAVPKTTQWLSRMWEEKPPKYSRATLETLALMAYRQPITRSEIEEIRGVSVSTNIIKSLQEREWIRVVGHRDVPGKPALYATTKEFLDYFDLKSLEDLPPLAEIKNLDEFDEQLEESAEAGDIDAIADLASEIVGERKGSETSAEVKTDEALAETDVLETEDGDELEAEAKTQIELVEDVAAEDIQESVDIDEMVAEANELEHLMHVTEDMSTQFEHEMEEAVGEFTHVVDVIERTAHEEGETENNISAEQEEEENKEKASEAEPL